MTNFLCDRFWAPREGPKIVWFLARGPGTSREVDLAAGPEHIHSVAFWVFSVIA